MKQKTFVLILVVMACLLLNGGNNHFIRSVAGGTRAYVIDQEQSTTGPSAELDTVGFYQTFTPSVDGIARISVYIWNQDTEDPTGRYANVTLDDASDGLTPLASGLLDLSGLISGGSWFDYTFTTVSITIGATYYILLRDPTFTTSDDSFGWSAVMSNAYADGFWSGNPSFDATFRTYYDDAVTPEFPNIFIIIAGLVPLLLLIYRGKTR